MRMMTKEVAPVVVVVKILPQEAIRDWVNPAVKPEELLSHALTAMAAEKAR